MTTALDNITKAVTAEPDFSTSADQNIASQMTTLVKGVGYANTDKPTRFGSSGNAPLDDPDQVFSRAMRAEKAWKAAHKASHTDPAQVLKGWNPAFTSQFGAFMSANPQNAAMATWVNQLQTQIGEAIGKNISLTSPLSSGLVPYDLVAPSRLIYPVN